MWDDLKDWTTTVGKLLLAFLLIAAVVATFAVVMTLLITAGHDLWEYIFSKGSAIVSSSFIQSFGGVSVKILFVISLFGLITTLLFLILFTVVYAYKKLLNKVMDAYSTTIEVAEKWSKVKAQSLKQSISIIALAFISERIMSVDWGVPSFENFLFLGFACFAVAGIIFSSKGKILGGFWVGVVFVSLGVLALGYLYYAVHVAPNGAEIIISPEKQNALIWLVITTCVFIASRFIAVDDNESAGKGGTKGSKSNSADDSSIE